MTKKLIFLVSLPAFLFGLVSCASFNQDAYTTAFSVLRQSAYKYQGEGKNVEVVYITRTLLDAEPENGEVQALQDKAIEAEPETSILIHKSILGANLNDRISNTNFPWFGRILLYIPNRFLDFLDLFSLEGGLCDGVGAKVKVTDAASLGAQVSLGEIMFGLNRRHLSARGTVEEFFEFFPFGFSYTAEGRGYTGGAYGISIPHAGIKRPTDRIYQRARDYWGVGAQIEFFVPAALLEVHPVEIFDFFAGLIFFDPLKDDIGVSRGIEFELTDNETASIQELVYQVRAR